MGRTRNGRRGLGGNGNDQVYLLANGRAHTTRVRRQNGRRYGVLVLHYLHVNMKREGTMLGRVGRACPCKAGMTGGWGRRELSTGLASWCVVPGRCDQTPSVRPRCGEEGGQQRRAMLESVEPVSRGVGRSRCCTECRLNVCVLVRGVMFGVVPERRSTVTKRCCHRY
jgi:hypothetical protein